MTDAEVIAAIRAHHLQGNLRDYAVQHWNEATVESGGIIFGPGPYLQLPVEHEGEEVMVRVYPPARLRRRLAKAWVR